MFKKCSCFAKCTDFMFTLVLMIKRNDTIVWLYEGFLVKNVIFSWSPNLFCQIRWFNFGSLVLVIVWDNWCIFICWFLILTCLNLSVICFHFAHKKNLWIVWPYSYPLLQTANPFGQLCESRSWTHVSSSLQLFVEFNFLFKKNGLL